MTAPRPHLARRARTAVAALVGLLAFALAGCGVRLETPPPVEPSPDAAEQVRARTVDDALALTAAARSARSTLADDDPAAGILDDVAAFSTAHADELGGVYDSGLPKPTPDGTPTTSPTPDAAPADVLAALLAATDVALADAEAYPDGPTARLLAAVGAARGDLAARLGTALAVEPAAPTAEPDAPTAEPTALPTGPAAVPEGVTADDVTALALAHDQAGYAFEVVAAKLADAPRAAAFASARTHRDAARAWVDRAATAGLAADPRQPVYALPAGLDETTAGALAVSLETAVADAASAAIPHAAPGARGELIALLRASIAAARTWGATATAFPGIPTP